MKDPEPNPLFAAALAYARRGWRVVPLHACLAPAAPGGPVRCSCGTDGCDSQGKHPRIGAWQRAATTDPEQVAKWWEKWPDANVGVEFGDGSGVVSIDVDTKRGEQHLEELAGGKPEKTLLYKTGKGWRLIYKIPLAVPCPPATHVVKLDGVEALRFQAAGAQSVMPPSAHPSGVRYAWVEGRGPDDGEPAEMPMWLLAEMCRPKAPVWSDAAAAGAFAEGGDFNVKGDWWRDVLQPAGYTQAGQVGDVLRFTRPGKRGGISVTVGHYRARDGSPALYVFSGNCPHLEAGRCYDRFGAFARLHCGGDFTRAAAELVRRGFAAPAAPVRSGLGTGPRPPERAAEWEHAIPLEESTDAAPPFPLGSFPAVIADHVRAVAESVYCPVDYPALATLAAASSAIGGAFVAKVKTDFFQGAGLYCCIVGDPSAKKSPPIKHVIRPIQKEQSARVERMRDDHGDDLPAVFKDGEGELFVQDVTVEKLGEMLQRQPRGLLLYKPELVGWLLSQNQYKAKGVGADRSFFLEVYDSDPITIHRKNMAGGMIFVSHPSLTMVGATQPEVVREFFARRDGLAERILWTFPPLLPPRGERWCETPADLTRRWGYVLEHLRGLPMRPADGEHKRPRAHVMPLAASARSAWEEFTDQLAATITDPDFPPWMRSAYGKFEGTAARLAMLLQLLDGASGGDSAGACEIMPRWVNAAMEMVFYFGAHARRVQQSCGSDPHLDGAKRIMLWVKDGKRTSFKRSELWESLRRNPLFRRSDDLSGPLALLATHNLIRAQAPGGDKGPGRPGAPTFDVCPTVIEANRKG